MILLKFTLKRLINANVQLSISNRRWNNFMKNFISFRYKNFYFFNLYKTIYSLRLVGFFISSLMMNRGSVIFIDKRIEVSSILLNLKNNLPGQDYIYNSWVSGGLTNFKEFKINEGLGRKCALLLNTGYYEVTRLPNIVISFSFYENLNSLTEAKILGLPVFTIISSDINPSGLISYIPGNDISYSSIYLFSQIFKFYIEKGLTKERYNFYKIMCKFCYFIFLKRIINHKRIF